MQPIVSAAEMREMDRVTIEDAGIPGIILMEHAGRALAEAARQACEDMGGGPVAVVCGKGNNGGDGLVAVRWLTHWGLDTYCLLVADRESIGGDALTNLDIVDTLGIEVLELREALNDEAQMILDESSVVIDAIFGTGLSDAPRGVAAEAIAAINSSGGFVVACDLPSGIEADTGDVLGEAVIADLTVTFAFPKLGLMVHPGCDHAGAVEVVDIGIPADVVEHVGASALSDADLAPPFLPPRPADCHKGHFGHILVVGGSPGTSGAVLLSGLAALRSGAGLVSARVDAATLGATDGRYPELMVSSDASPEGKDVVLLGPGLVPDEAGRALLEAAYASGARLVLDAGALRLWQSGDPSPAVITPHPGEAAALLGCEAADVQANRFGALNALVEGTRGVVILKGARTLIGAPGMPVFVNSTGNAGMATAGTGDVLAGIVAAMLPRFDDAVEAARVAVHVHGLCGDRVAAAHGPESLVASDLIAALPGVLKGQPGKSND